MSRHRAIYRGPSGDTVLHSEGFSLFAALFLPVWAATRGLYRTAAVALIVPLVLNLLLLMLQAPLGPQAYNLLSSAAVVGSVIAAGSFASRWHRFVLERAGWQVIAGPPEKQR